MPLVLLVSLLTISLNPSYFQYPPGPRSRVSTTPGIEIYHFWLGYGEPERMYDNGVYCETRRRGREISSRSTTVCADRPPLRSQGLQGSVHCLVRDQLVVPASPFRQRPPPKLPTLRLVVHSITSGLVDMGINNAPVAVHRIRSTLAGITSPTAWREKTEISI